MCPRWPASYQKDIPNEDRRLYRVLAVAGMIETGLNAEQIATELGISARHVRRLARRSASRALRRAAFRRTKSLPSSE